MRSLRGRLALGVMAVMAVVLALAGTFASRYVDHNERAALDDRLDAYAEAPVPAYDGLPRMVNRNDAAVPAVLVAGQHVVRDGVPTALLGEQRTGRFLRAR